MHFDSNGLIIQRNGDGGDTFARHMGARFVHWVLQYMNCPVPFVFPNMVDEDIKWLGPNDKGICVRSPDPGPDEWHWNNPANFSRDQMIPGILFLGTLADKSHLHRLFKACWKRSMTSQNGDVLWATGSIWARAFKKHLWLCWLFDLAILVDVLVVLTWLPRHKHDYDFGNGKRGSKWFWFQDDKDFVDMDMNLVLVLTQAAVIYDTPITKLARHLYSERRPVTWGVLTLGELNRVIGALAWYCRYNPSTGNFGNPDWATACRPIVNQWF
jgi:hypothetical protein